MNRLKYSWLKQSNEWNPQADASTYNWLDDIPDGWVESFGEAMVDELNDILVKYNLLDSYRVEQTKEKYGGLRWYDSGVSKEASEEYYTWLKKYEDLSEITCVYCGASAKIRTDIGWILPICDEHYIRVKNRTGEFA